MSRSDESGEEPRRGLVIVYTGDGKGKTTAALGLCLRAIGHGNKVCIIQFIKSDWAYGELEALKRLSSDVEVKTLGAGCIGILGDDKPTEVHRQAAAEALRAAEAALCDAHFDVVILDEVHIAMHLGLLTSQAVLDIIDRRREQVTVVLTGRYAPREITDRADLVTEMKEIKHPFRQGYLSKKGIDY